MLVWLKSIMFVWRCLGCCMGCVEAARCVGNVCLSKSRLGFSRRTAGKFVLLLGFPACVGLLFSLLILSRKQNKRPPASQEVVGLLSRGSSHLCQPYFRLGSLRSPVSREEAGFKGNELPSHTLPVFCAAVSVFRLHEKKHKTSKDLPEAEGTSEEAGDYCGDSSCFPMDEKPLSEQPKEPGVSSGEGKSNPVPLDTGQQDFLNPSRNQAGDHKESSTGTHAPCWDFTTIILPNVASDQPCTHLPSPDHGLLPENVPGREVDASHWCACINQKQEKLSRKEREQRERESRYKSSVNTDQEVRRCSNWQEYKALLEQRRQQRVWRRPPHLWDQAVTPLLQPDEVTSSGSGCGNLTETPSSPQLRETLPGVQQQKG